MVTDMQTGEAITYKEQQATDVATRRERRVQERRARRERRVQERCAQILQAAARVFATKGYERATTREIAAEADVSEGVLYYYFDNKRDLLINLMQSHIDSTLTELEDVIEDVKAGDIHGFVQALLFRRFCEVETSRQLANVVIREIFKDAEMWRDYHRQALVTIVAKIEKQMKTAIASGTLRPVHTGIAARAMIGMVQGLIMLRLIDDPQIASMSIEELTRELTSLIMDGLRARPEEARPSG
jgi:AcrR family transcriptional regulator